MKYARFRMRPRKKTEQKVLRQRFRKRASITRHAPFCCEPSKRSLLELWAAWTRKRSDGSSTNTNCTHRDFWGPSDALATKQVTEGFYEWIGNPQSNFS